jgi:hypothetical protein
MPELFNNIVCVSAPELIDGTDPILNNDTYIQYAYRNPHVRVRRGSPAGPALLNWDMLRADLKVKYIEKYKQDPKDVAKPLTFISQITTDYKAVDWFARWELPDKRNLKPERQKEYSTNASVLNTLLHISNDRKALRKALGGKTTGIWKELAARVENIKTELQHSLPTNPIRLKEKVKKYAELGYVSIIPDKYMNNNAAKVTETEQQAALRQLFRKHNNLDNAQIQMLYNIIAENLAWDKITAATVSNYRVKWEMETHSGRKGENSFDNTKAMLVKRSAPSYPLYYWTSDGWDAELLYQNTEIDGKGNSKTTFHNRLTVVVVLDPCVKYPIGFAIGTHETPELIKEAFRNAVTHTKELFGDYYKVLQLQTDNYGKKALTPIYDVLSETYTPARVHNAKAKVIEPYFNHINRKYCQLMPNWSGFGIASGSSKQPNTEYLNKIRHSFPDEFGVRHQITQIIEAERLLNKEKYITLFNEMPVEDKKPIDIAELLYLCGEKTGFTNRLSASGLVVTIAGQKHEYDSFDLQFRQLAHVEWTVKYNPEDTTQVLAMSDDGHRFMLQEKYVQPMALRERKEGDSEQLAKINQFNKTIKAEITEGMAEDYRTVEQLFNDNPRLDNTLAKLVLVDSTGQHKDNKSAARLKGAQKQLAKQTRKEEVEEQRNWSQEQEAYLKDKVDISNYINQ